MNNTTTISDHTSSDATSVFVGSEEIGGFGYGIGVSLVEIMGIDEATLLSYPKLLYSEAKVNNNYNKEYSSSSTATCCTICLADYKDSDMLRLLQDCGHLFHLKCVDPWLMLNPSCPICRTSPLPTPQSTPLADVVPLASRPSGLMLHA
ncbi:hypothetical protein HAX54_001211 [Datura stramonium]|uniref:RING-type domain-containing protein n=1 Tax=Datura stramonium TaxID=4076 RepID=A0ABS8T3I2_DATST|nr:hypothetical protein [Datura stramonium]